MKRILTFLILYLISSGFLNAQICDFTPVSVVHHGNGVRAIISSDGLIGYSSPENEPGLSVEYNPDHPVSAIESSILWFFALDPAGNALISQSANLQTQRKAFTPGVINHRESYPDTASCHVFNKVWKVSGHEIKQHMLDYDDNRQIDNPIPSIYQWPGNGNPHFEEENDYSLSNNPYGFAPFYDEDLDGIYNPDKGDYPIVANYTANWYPEVYGDITWCAYYPSNFQPRGIHVYQQTWNFSCTDIPILDNTIFIEYQILNSNVENYDKFYMGKYVDFNLGCPEDDYIGCDTSLNSFFVYNMDNIDGDSSNICSETFSHSNKPMPGRPGIQVITYYERYCSEIFPWCTPEMSAFVPYTEEFDNYFQDIDHHVQIYNLVQGKWPDGSPIYTEGLGYFPMGSTEPTTTWAFNGDPKIPGSYSMIGEEIDGSDWKALASFDYGIFNVGTSEYYQFAYSYHPGLHHHLYNFSFLEENLEEINDYRGTGFHSPLCDPYDCRTDCVWPGDANNDGVVTGIDFFYVGQNIGQIGSPRAGFLSWRPYGSLPWQGQEFYNTNLKYLDCNGDGQIHKNDARLVNQHFYYTHDQEEYPNDRRDGNDVRLNIVQIGGSFDPDNMSANQRIFISPTLNDQWDSLFIGITYDLFYDKRYFEKYTYKDIFEIEDIDMINTIDINNSGIISSSKYSFNDRIKNGGFNALRLKTLSEFSIMPQSTEIYLSNIYGLKEDGTIMQLSSTPIEITFPEISTSIEDISEIKTTIYPNPTSDVILVKSDLNISNLQLFNHQGKQLINRKNDSIEFSLDLSKYPAGIYFVKLLIKDRWVVRKVVKN